MQTHSQKILIVDDNPSNIQLLGTILNANQYTAEFATSGADALEWLNNESFDLVLLDIMMPGMDGYEVCRRIKADKETAHIPVIFITAKQDTDSIVKGFDVGAVDYISKPFEERELLARLAFHLELLTARRKLEVLNSELQEKNDTMMQSLRYAEKLQEAMLPADKELKTNFNAHFVLFKPLHHLSGDFYWAKNIGNKTLLVLGDSMGHGIPGALLSVLGMSSLNDITDHSSDISPASILTKLRDRENNLFSSNAGIMHDSIDMAVCLFDPENNTLTFSGANLPVAIVSSDSKPGKPLNANTQTLTNNDKNLTYIPGNKNTIGRNLFESDFENITIQLSKGDKIYLFSDGFRDQFGGAKGSKFKKKRFLNLLLETSTLNAEKQKTKLNSTFEKWKGNQPQIDDVTIIGIQPT
ncbi:response regulator [Salinivirga cyanobacteriivorans]